MILKQTAERVHALRENPSRVPNLSISNNLNDVLRYSLSTANYKLSILKGITAPVHYVGTETVMALFLNGIC